MSLFRKKTREDYRRERAELYKERSRLLKQQEERKKYQERVNYRKEQTENLKREISELKYGKYKKALKIVGRDLSNIAKPIGRSLSAVGKKIATPTEADKERIKQRKSITYDYGNILGYSTNPTKKKVKLKKQKSLLDGILN